MAASSFLPMRRNTISSLPAGVSKYQTPFLLTNGIGSGQFSAPTTTVIVPFVSITNRCISWYLTTKPVRASESSAESPDERTSFPAGPRMLKGASSSGACMAAKKARAASSAEAKVRCSGCWANIGADEHPNESANRTDTANRTKPLHSSCAKIEILCSMVFPFYSLIFVKLYMRIYAITDVVHRHHENHHHGSHLQSSTARGRKSLEHCRRDQSR